MALTTLTKILTDQPKYVFLPKSCEVCLGEASYDIMTSDGRWQFLCPFDVGAMVERLVAGYPIKVLQLDRPRNTE